MNLSNSSLTSHIKYFILIFSCFYLSGCTQKENTEGYVVEGTINGAENKKIYLQDNAFYHDDHPKDSVLADDQGHFIFRGVMKEPTLYLIRVEGVNGLVDFFMENSRITIVGAKDSLWKASVSGSRENDLRAVFVTETHLSENQIAYDKLERAYDSARLLGDTTANTRWTVGKKALEKKLHKSVLQFLRQYPTSVVGVNSLVYFLDTDLTTADSLMQTLQQTEVANHGQVVRFKDMIDKKKKLLPGQPAPVFSQPDITGKMISLDSFNGNYVLIDFWASWCGPCRQENPNLVKAYEKYKAKNFTILSVSLDNKKDNWLKAIEKDKLTAWTHVSDLKGAKNGAAVLYGVDAIPINYLIDSSGKIVAKNLRGEEVEKTLRQLLP